MRDDAKTALLMATYREERSIGSLVCANISMQTSIVCVLLGYCKVNRDDLTIPG
jgi:hypothetical protein